MKKCEIIEGLKENDFNYYGTDVNICFCRKCGKVIQPIESIMLDGICSDCHELKEYNRKR